MKILVCEYCGFRNRIPDDHHGQDPRFAFCIFCLAPLD